MDRQLLFLLIEKEFRDMAFLVAIRCVDVDNSHKIELLKAVQMRYARLVASIDIRLNPS